MSVSQCVYVYVYVYVEIYVDVYVYVHVYVHVHWYLCVSPVKQGSAALVLSNNK